nr:M48 family metallopeptidase [uncultured Bdellovibrio sp.]
MTLYRAKYFDGTKPESHLVEVSIKNAVLEITKEGEILDHWPLKLIYRDNTHLSIVMLACQGEDDARLEILDKNFLKELQGKTSVSKKGPLNVGTKEVLFWIVGIVTAISLLFMSVKPVTKFLAKKVSHETERKLLSSAISFAKPDYCTLSMEQSFALEKLLSRIYPQSAEDKDLGVQIHIVKNPIENAFALPGAEIWIYNGLLQKAQSPEEIAGVLAHEIEHVKQRHVLETIVRGTLLTSFLSLAAGDASGALLVDPQTAANLLSLNYDRDMESNADEGARQRLKAARVSTQGIINFFERNQKKGIEIPKFLSTHPLSEERIQKFKADIKEEKSEPLLTKQEWATLQSACK